MSQKQPAAAELIEGRIITTFKMNASVRSLQRTQKTALRGSIPQIEPNGPTTLNYSRKYTPSEILKRRHRDYNILSRVVVGFIAWISNGNYFSTTWLARPGTEVRVDP